MTTRTRAGDRPRTRATWSHTAGVVALLGALSACSAPVAQRPPDVLIVLVDTLRADRLGAYGNPRQLTPFLDYLATRGHLFEHAYAPSSWTNPSVASLFTARMPSQHRVIAGGSRLQPGETTLAEALAASHYATAAFVANPALDGKRKGFAQGFDTFEILGLVRDPDGTFRKQSATSVNDRVFAWLDGLAQHDRPPVFLYVHYMEPHGPYAPPTEVLDRVLQGRPRMDVAAIVGRLLADPRLTGPDLEAAQAIYDAEVASVDEGIFALFAGLERRGILDHTVIVFTADHGDEFMDHGALGHGHTLYEELIRIPLFVSAPGTARNVTIATPVSLIDVAPTILDLAGLPRLATFAGDRLPGFAHDPGTVQSPPRTVTSELPVQFHGALATTAQTSQQLALVLGRLKLIAGQPDVREAYDLAQDPHEASPLAADHSARKLLEAQLPALPTAVGANAPPQPPIDESLREQLRALGYLR